MRQTSETSEPYHKALTMSSHLSVVRLFVKSALVPSGMGFWKRGLWDHETPESQLLISDEQNIFNNFQGRLLIHQFKRYDYKLWIMLKVLTLLTSIPSFYRTCRYYIFSAIFWNYRNPKLCRFSDEIHGTDTMCMILQLCVQVFTQTDLTYPIFSYNTF